MTMVSGYLPIILSPGSPQTSDSTGYTSARNAGAVGDLLSIIQKETSMVALPEERYRNGFSVNRDFRSRGRKH